MTTLNNEDPADPSVHHPGCPTPGDCSAHGCHGSCLEDDDDEPVCARCRGDGRDPMADYLLPCPLCQGDHP